MKKYVYRSYHRKKDDSFTKIDWILGGLFVLALIVVWSISNSWG